MANEDLKLSMGFDLDALRKSADEAKRVFQAQFSNVGGSTSSGAFAGMLLGGGGNVTAPPSMAKDTLRSVVDVLERIQATLQAGFTAMSGGGNGAGSTPGTPGGPPRGPNGQFLPQNGGGGGGGPTPRKSGINWTGKGGVFSMADMFPQQAYADLIGGTGYRSDWLNFASASPLGKLPVIGQALGLVSNEYAKSDTFLGESLNAWRGGGDEGRQGLREVVQDEIGRSLMRDTGTTRSQVSGYLQQMLSYGGTSSTGIEAMMRMGNLGMAGEGAGLMRSLVHSGGARSGEEYTVFQDALSAAIATGLDRARWGEAVTAMTKAADRLGQVGDVSRAGLVEMETFIGGMSQRYQGDTAGHARMQGIVQGLETGEGGDMLVQLASLRAAGLGQPGVDYLTAEGRARSGYNTGKGGLARVMQQLAPTDPAVQNYLNGTMSLDAAAALFVRMHPGLSGNVGDVKELLQAMQRGTYGGPNAAAAETAGTALHQRAPSPEGGWIENMVEQSIRGTGVGPSGGTTNPNAFDANATYQGRARRNAQGGHAALRGPTVMVNGAALSDVITQAEARYQLPAGIESRWFGAEGWDPRKTGGLRGGDSAYGYGQFSGEELGRLGLSKAQIESLPTDQTLDTDVAARMIKKYYGTALGQAKEMGWDPSNEMDVERLAKLQTNLPSAARAAVGTGAHSWDELVKKLDEMWANRSAADRDQLARVLADANRMVIDVRHAVGTPAPQVSVKPAGRGSTNTGQMHK